MSTRLLAGLQMRLRLLPGCEQAGALQGDIDAHRLVRQLGGVADRGHLDRPGADVDGVARDLHLAGEAPMDQIEPQEVGVGLDQAEVVDRDDLDILASGPRRSRARCCDRCDRNR